MTQPANDSTQPGTQSANANAGGDQHVPLPTDGPDNGGIDWKANSRKWEKRAKDSFAAQSELDALKAKYATDTEQYTKKLSEAEDAIAKAEAKALRRDVALEHGLSKADAALLDAVTDHDAMTALAQRLAAQSSSASNNNNGAYVPNEGNTPPALNSDQLEQALRTKLGIA